MKTPLKIAGTALALGLVGAAGSAQACACARHHHVRTTYWRSAYRGHYRAPVRYVRPVVTRRYYEPAYGGSWYGPSYYASGDYTPYGYDYDYSYVVDRPVYSYWRPRPVVVGYGAPAYWGYRRDWDDDWRWRGHGWRGREHEGHHDNGRHRGWGHGDADD